MIERDVTPMKMHPNLITSVVRGFIRAGDMAGLTECVSGMSQEELERIGAGTHHFQYTDSKREHLMLREGEWYLGE